MSNIPQLSLSAPDRKRLVNAIAAHSRANELTLEKMLPAKVVSYNRATNTATVQPLIAVVMTDNTAVSRNEVAEIPVLSIGGGGFHISFPLVAGDLGWIYASDREISGFLQSLKEAVPTHGVCHKFDSGMFIPDVYRQYTIAAEDAGAMVIQALDATTRISIKNGQVKIVAPTKVIVDSPMVEFTGSVNIAMNLVVIGNTTLTKQIMSVIAGVDLATHRHRDSANQPTTTPIQ